MIVKPRNTFKKRTDPVMIEAIGQAILLHGRKHNGALGPGCSGVIQVNHFLRESRKSPPGCSSMVTDQPERIIVGELIREKALLMLREEVPHGVGVGVDKMERREDRDMMDIYATIYCERESHKGIIIGKGGSMLKRIGQESRKDIEWMLGCPVNLQLWIKIKEDWRNRPGMLHELGYE
ncbi:MAG: KH domain-containing protein [Alphaproteobacteria bacterium]|nr:KH domain-containing protein [Alphaproteobacteria bacterium]